MSPSPRVPGSQSPPDLIEGWRARTIHTITCPSGQVVKIKIPGIAGLLEHGKLPESLYDIAMAEITDTISVEGMAGPSLIPGSTQWVAKAEEMEEKLERMQLFGSFQRHLVASAMVDPELSYEEITDAVMEGTLPEDDLAMIAEIVQRMRSYDARGVRIGVEPLDRWATFRATHLGIPCTGDETCPGCQEIRRQLSSLDLDEM